MVCFKEMLQVIIDKLGWSQLKIDFSAYDFESFRADLSAGMLVAAVGFPSVMAFAMLAGLNPVYGLYSFVVAAMVGTFVGVTHYIVMGPTNIVALMIASALGGFAVVGPEKMELVLLLTFMAGAIQIGLSFLNFSKLANYISRSVITALLAGIAVIIAVGQLVKILGLQVEGKESVISSLYQIGTNLGKINPTTLLVALITILTILVVRNISRRAPAYLLGLIFSVGVVHFFGLSSEISMVAGGQGGLPGFSFPTFDLQLALKLFSYSFAIAILGFVEVLTLVEFNKKGSVDSEQVDKELCGLGVMNLTCSFFNGFAGGGSFSRSFTNLEAGAKTRFSQLIAGIFVLLFLLFFGGLIELLPTASLGAILILIAFEMVDWKQIKTIFTTKKFDALIFAATFVAVIFIPRLDYAIYLSILFSLALLLKDTSKLEYSFLEMKEGAIEQKLPEEIENGDKVIIDLAGSLHFNKVNKLKKELQEALDVGNYFVVRMRNVKEIDITAMSELEEFIDKVKNRDGDVFFAGLSEGIREDFDEYGLTEKLDEDNFFSKDEKLFDSSKKALKEAEEEGEQ